MSAYASLPHFFFFFFNHSKSAAEHRWHHFLPSGTIWLQRLLLILLLILPAYLLLIFSHRSPRASSPVIFLRLHRHPQTALAVWLCVHLPPPPLLSLSSQYFHCVPLPRCSSPSLAPLFFFTPVSVFVTDSSAPQEHWGEQRKQRFGSVTLILIFCRLDGRLGGAFIHTPHNHFPCNCTNHDCRPQGLQLSAQICHLWQGVSVFST